MAQFRQVQPSVIQMPTVSPEVNQDLIEAGKILAQTLQGVAGVTNIVTNQMNNENNKLAQEKGIILSEIQNAPKEMAAKLNAQAQLQNELAQQAETERRKKLDLQQRGKEALLANATEAERGSILAKNPELYPEVQDDIATFVARDFAQKDHAKLLELIAADPSKDINTVAQQLSAERYKVLTDPISQNKYKLSFETMQSETLSNALIASAKADAVKAADGAYGLFQQNVIRASNEGTIDGASFTQAYDALVETVQRFKPDASKEDIRSNVFRYLSSAIGDNALGLDLDKIQAPLAKMAEDLKATYPEFTSISKSVNSLIAERKVAMSAASFSEQEDIIKSAPTSAVLEYQMKAAEDNFNKQVYSQSQFLKLKEAYSLRTEKIQAKDYVRNYLGNPSDPDDNNKLLPIGPQHYDAIDELATEVERSVTNRGGYWGPTNKAAWMVSNFNQLTPNMLGALRNQASSNDPVALLSAFSTFKAVYDSNPGYAQSIADGKTLPTRFNTAISLSVLGGEDVGLVLNQLADVADEDLIAARKLFTAPAKAGSTDTATGLPIKDLYYIGRKVDAGNIANAKIQSLYLDAASMFAAKMTKQTGIADPQKVAEAADVMATSFLRRNVTTVELDGDKQLITVAQEKKIGFDKGQWKNVDSIWQSERKRIAQSLGVSREDISIDLTNTEYAITDGKSVLRIPVSYAGIAGFGSDATGVITYVDVPLDRVELKKAAEGKAYKPTPLTPAQQKALDKYESSSPPFGALGY